MNKKTFYITTPIYYPSGSLHIGHLYTTTLARTIANYKELMGYDVKMLTGADEHGQKIQQKAEEEKINPQAYVDRMADQFKKLWETVNISYDFFSRTTSDYHKKAVAKIFTDLMNKGDIYKGKYKGLYSISDEEFLTPTQAVEKDGEFFHPTSGHKLVAVEEESYFFKMSKYSSWLTKYIEENPEFIKPKKIVNELMNNFINKGLEDLSISRNTFSWGIKINEDPSHVIYVWLDALSNYITALGYNSGNIDNFDKYWKNGDEIVHLVGKEITRFHCIYWPIILKTLGLREPTKIISHGWIITPEGKMSKSKGNVVDPLELIKEFGEEEVKYFFAGKISTEKDGIFDKEILKNVINSELANNYGNLLSRTIAMIKQNFDGSVKYKTSLESVDQNIFSSILKTKDKYIQLMDNFKIDIAIEEVMKLSKELNGYIDITMPWTLKENKARLEVVLNTLLNGIYAVTVMLSPLIPTKTSHALKQLNLKDLSIENIGKFDKFNDVIVEKGDNLFSRLK